MKERQREVCPTCGQPVRTKEEDDDDDDAGANCLRQHNKCREQQILQAGFPFLHFFYGIDFVDGSRLGSVESHPVHSHHPVCWHR